MQANFWRFGNVGSDSAKTPVVPWAEPPVNGQHQHCRPKMKNLSTNLILL